MTTANDKPEIFGICRRLGDDLGIHPNVLRIALALGMVFSIEGVVAAYITMGLIVLASRLLSPEPKRVAETRQETPATTQDVSAAPVLRKAA
ncbi:MAG: PspC domain-containing protein [Sphingomonas bacterium]